MSGNEEIKCKDTSLWLPYQNVMKQKYAIMQTVITVQHLTAWNKLLFVGYSQGC
jgi:hypothetical protein